MQADAFPSRPVLHGDSTWSRDKLTAAIAGVKERTVALGVPCPRLILYATVWVDRNGDLPTPPGHFGTEGLTTDGLLVRCQQDHNARASVQVHAQANFNPRLS
jgi:hypothetical protein